MLLILFFRRKRHLKTDDGSQKQDDDSAPAPDGYGSLISLSLITHLSSRISHLSPLISIAISGSFLSLKLLRSSASEATEVAEAKAPASQDSSKKKQKDKS